MHLASGGQEQEHVPSGGQALALFARIAMLCFPVKNIRFSTNKESKSSVLHLGNPQQKFG
jgi:hypothetical protein